MTDQTESQRVLLTGATGFVGGYVLKKLVSSGYVPVCVVRDSDKFAARTELYPGAEIVSVRGDVTSPAAVQKAARQCNQAIHLVGIIMERGENTFGRVHYEGTKNVVQACKDAGIKRLVHMSALGTRPDAVSKYHQSKHMAEQCVMQSGLDWTIFRPSLIHGPEGELMQLLKTFACSAVLPPVMPYFGKGENRMQPVDVRDVAECFVKVLSNDRTIHRTYELGGPRSYSWKELYQLCKRCIPGAKQWKPLVGQPVFVAKLLARTVMKVPMPIGKLDRLRFDVGQVQMSQEDSVCDITAAERDLDIAFRDFESELTQYADQIR